MCSSTQREFEEARSRKLRKSSYCQLASALECRGLQVVYTTLEVGALGHYRPQAVKTLHTMVPNLLRGGNWEKLPFLAPHIFSMLGTALYGPMTNPSSAQ